jgi:phage regulator Rha-like protein
MIFVNELKIIKKEYGIFDKKGEFFADSLIVAKIFEKNHDDLLKTIPQ